MAADDTLNPTGEKGSNDTGREPCGDADRERRLREVVESELPRWQTVFDRLRDT